MTGWIVFGGVMALLLFLLCWPVAVDVSVKADKPGAVVRYLFFRRNLLPDIPAGEKASPPKTRRKKKPREKDGEKLEKEKRSLTELLPLVWDMLKGSRGGLRTLRRHLVFSRVEIYICVGGEDAHRTALRYTHLCMAVVAALDVIGMLFVLRRPKVGVAPDFTKASTRYELGARVSIRPLFALGAALRVAAGLAFALLRDRKRPRPPTKPRTDREPAKSA